MGGKRGNGKGAKWMPKSKAKTDVDSDGSDVENTEKPKAQPKERKKVKKVRLLPARQKEKVIPRARTPLLPVRLSNRVSLKVINRSGMKRPGGPMDGPVLTGTERLGDF